MIGRIRCVPNRLAGDKLDGLATGRVFTRDSEDQVDHPEDDQQTDDEDDADDPSKDFEHEYLPYAPQ